MMQFYRFPPILPNINLNRQKQWHRKKVYASCSSGHDWFTREMCIFESRQVKGILLHCATRVVSAQSDTKP